MDVLCWTGKIFNSIKTRAFKHLHGGGGGVSQRRWTITEWSQSSVTLALHVPDGDQGFPGNMDIRCTYGFAGDTTLGVDIHAVSDAATVVDFAQRSFFNLDGASDIRNHRLRILADAYTPVER